MTEAEKELIYGRTIRLSRNREVWLGVNNDHELCLRFLNEEGTATHVKLSQEAMEALISLYNARDSVQRGLVWAQVLPTETGEGELVSVKREDEP